MSDTNENQIGLLSIMPYYAVEFDPIEQFDYCFNLNRITSKYFWHNGGLRMPKEQIIIEKPKKEKKKEPKKIRTKPINHFGVTKAKVKKLYLEGKTNNEIAKILCKSKSGIFVHLENIKKELKK